MAEGSPIRACCLLFDAEISAVGNICSSQFRCAAVSVAANIAEGFRKRGKADKLRFLNIAQGSLEESRYYLILVRDLDYGDISELKTVLVEVSKLLEAYSRAILNSDS